MQKEFLMKNIKIIQSQKKIYEQNFIKFGDKPNGTFQNNYETMYLRFENLFKPFKDILSNNFSVCDVGSGVSDFHQFLLNKKIIHRYTGCEIIKDMISVSKKKFPEATFHNKNYLDLKIKNKFDISILSGTFNKHGEVSNHDWEEFIYSIIMKMYSSSNIGISFNALHTFTSYRSDDLFYLDTLKTLNLIQKEISRFCILDFSIPLFEVTYTIFNPEIVKIIYSDQVFNKYFNLKI